MATPDWETALRSDLEHTSYDARELDRTLAAALPHIEAAYQRGLMAGRSQTGYTSRRKKKEAPCLTSMSAPGAGGSDASAGEP